jgi:hypothetical protein
MAAPLYTFEFAHAIPDFWELSDEQLAKSCIAIAQGCLPHTRPFVRAEATRLFLLWRDTMNAACPTREDVEENAGALAALRKRTIQVLVRVSIPSGSRALPS